MPILMLSARTDTVDIVVGPRAWRRRLRDEAVRDGGARRPGARGVETGLGAAGGLRSSSPADLEIDPRASARARAGRTSHLTATEFKLLQELARRPGQVFTRELLLERVWNYEYLGDSRLVDVAVQRLRAKIEDDPRHSAADHDRARGRLPLREP